jgi:hypothetical protein
VKPSGTAAENHDLHADFNGAKYYTLEDLRAVNAFYSSPAGQKIRATVPKVMPDHY